MPIRKLPPLLVNQIAAGEVIERPASVVKELVENSLDASARRIEITIEDGGRQLIRISDDGLGIPAEELPLAVAPHATSKLRLPEELAAIATLGFRGEALASIASVSRLRITSRATIDGRAAEAGAVLEASGDDLSAVTPAAGAPGTVIEVRDLFFNTPARRKFMRSAPIEFGHIAEIVSRIAMVRNDVTFTLSHNGRRTLEAAAGQDRRRRCLDVMGRELEPALLEFDSRGDRLAAPTPGGNPGSHTGNNSGGSAGLEIWGLAGLPAIARPTAKFQYVCVNGRPIRDRNLAHAIREAYRGLTPPDKQPVAVVFIWMDPTAVDVNVHPTKSEVRFLEPSRIHGAVMTALRQRLLAADLTPRAGFPGGLPGGFPIADFRLPIEEGAGEPGNGALPAAMPTATALEIGNRQSEIGNSPPGAPSVKISTDAFVDYFRRMDPREKGFAYQQVKAALAEDPQAPAVADGTPESIMPALIAPVLRAAGVLQIHNSYLVTQDEQGLLIVDQHALHERVMFEELYQRISGDGRKLESQRLLMPDMIEASLRKQALLEDLAPLLDRLGIEAAPMGPTTIGIQAFPSLLFDRGVEPGPFVGELLDKAEENEFDLDGPTAQEAALHKVLDMMACKAAVKAGDRMKPEELAALLARREQIERASNCPHGRPTTIRLTLRDLEKQFKRV